jgi:methionyl-tRNA formyltransferase
MGTPSFAVPILKSIHESRHKVLEVYTQSPKKKNRGQKINLSPIHEYANEINIPVRHPVIIDTQEELKHIKEIKPDIAVVVAYGKILPSNILNLVHTKFINIHASLLPKWRGAAPIQRAIMNMDDETGISIMKIVPKLDSGPILIKSKLKISKTINTQELSDKMSNLASRLILKALDAIEKNEAKFTEQEEIKATYAKKINKAEAKINWNDKAKKIIAKINAFHPNPGCWFNLLGSRVKILRAEEVKIKGKPGVILNNKFTIACSENAVRILELKKEGKKKMKAFEFLKGNKLTVGSNINTDA